MERRKFCVIGYPIMHSKSPELFEEIFRRWGLEGCSYEKVEVRSSEELTAFFEGMRRGAYDACNVTMPLKTEAAGMLDGLTGEAAALCAVNSVICTEGGLFGHSTDGGGMCSAIEARGGKIEKSRIVLLGSGGAARSIAAAAISEGCESLTVICRPGRNRELMEEMLQRLCPDPAENKPASETGTFLSGRCARSPKEICSFVDYSDGSAAGEAAASADILINATSIGMTPHEEECALPAGAAFHAGMIAADAVYEPEETAFLKRAAECGCITVTGLEMLKWQAERAAEFFRK